MPVLAGVACAGFSVDGFARDKDAARKSVAAQREMLQILRILGEPLGVAGGLARTLPGWVARGLLWAMPWGVRGFQRQMIEVHFRKVHAQTYWLLGEFRRAAAERGLDMPALDALLARTPSASS